jgi:hypothetical protein
MNGSTKPRQMSVVWIGYRDVYLRGVSSEKVPYSVNSQGKRPFHKANRQFAWQIIFDRNPGTVASTPNGQIPTVVQSACR